MIDVAPERVVITNPSGKPIDIKTRISHPARKTLLFRTYRIGKNKSTEHHAAPYQCQKVRGYKRKNGKEVEQYRRGPERNNPAFWDDDSHNYVPVIQE